MPRSNKRGAGDNSGATRKSSRTPARPEPASTKQTRGASASSDASPAKASRKASPSPAPTGRGRSAKAAATKAGDGKGQGDQSTSKGRVTRAVVKDKEEEVSTTRGRSSTRKTEKAKEPAPTRGGRAKSSGTPSKAAKATPKKETPKGGRGRSAKGRGKKEEPEEPEEVSEDEEEEEEEEEPPKKQTPKSTPKGRGKTAAKAKTPSPVKQSPKTTPKPAASRSRSRGGNKGEVTSPTVVLEKMDTADLGESGSTLEVKSPVSRRGRNLTPKATPSPSARGSRSRRGAKKEEDEEEEIPSEDKQEAEEEPEKSEESTEAEKNVEKDESQPEEKEQKATEEEGEEKQEETGEEQKEEEVTDKQLEEEVSEKQKEEEVTKTTEETSEATKPDETVEEPEEKEKVPTEDEPEEMETEEKVEAISENEEEKEEAESEPVEEEKAVEESPPEPEPVETSAAAVQVAQQTVPSINVTAAPEDDVSSVAVEPATPVQISDDSCSVEEVEPVQNEQPIVQNSVCQEKEAMDVDTSEESAVVEGAQNGELESRKRKIEDVEETEEEDTLAKRTCVTEVQSSEPLQENGETLEQAKDGREKVTQFMDDATIHNAEEDYVVINKDEVPASNSKEVLASIPPSVAAVEQTDSIKSNPQKLGPVFNRKFIANQAFNMATSDPAKQFTVVSYNILAQCHLERNDYSFTSSEFLKLEHRHQKMMSEFQYLESDVVCLQEVGPAYFENTLKPSMKSLGYSGVMLKRTDDDFDEGEATFWKDSRFTLVKSEMHPLAKLAEKEVDDAKLDTDVRTAVMAYLDRPDVLVLTQLRCNFTNNIVTVGNIHVQWGKMEVPDIQCIQIACAIKALSTLAENDSTPHILCGDFNSEITSPGYQLVLEGYLSDDMIDKLQSIENVILPDETKKALFNQLYRAFQHPASNIKSSYLIATGKEPSCTSFNRVMRAAVDYIFFSASNLDSVGVLEVAAESRITETGGIPDATFPSDHVSMKSTFSFR